MRISIFGLGYVGAVSAACMADAGLTVIGVDSDHEKVKMMRSSLPPVTENGLTEIMMQTIKNSHLRVTGNCREAVEASDVSIICVGTPGKDGSIDFTALKSVCADIGKALKAKNTFHVVVVRSTILPGTMRKIVIPTLERASGKKAMRDFGVCHNPEFLREGNAIYDFRNPARIVIGADDTRTAGIVKKLYRKFPGKTYHCPIEVAEMIKCTENSWHATKVAFANEIGNLCKAHSIDSHEVMDIFCEDTPLNLSPYYLKPGMAFGGSCLPKDVRAVTGAARGLQIASPLLNALLDSNDSQIQRGLDMVLATGKKRIGFLGLSFKAGTDDLRESPMVKIASGLLQKKRTLHIYDSNIKPGKLSVSNRAYLSAAAPEIESALTASIERVLEADVIVIGNASPEFTNLSGKLKQTQIIVDFVRMRELEKNHKNYNGICW